MKTRQGCYPHVGTAVLLAAGKGSRLFQCARQPKPLVPVCGRSLAERAVCTFATELGVQQLIVVVGHEASAIETHFRGLAGKSNAEFEFVLAHNWSRGNGASTLSVKQRVCEEPFFVTMTDLLFESQIGKVMKHNPPCHGEVCMAVSKDLDQIFDDDDITGVRLDGNHVVELGNNLDTCDAAAIGLFLCTKGLFDGVERAAQYNCHELTDGLRELSASGHLVAVDVTGSRWLDVDTPAALSEADRWLGGAHQ